MRHLYFLYGFSKSSFVVLLLSPFFYACTSYNFSHPLPVDKPNIYEFPEAWRGSWIDEDNMLVIIGRNNAAVVVVNTEKVVEGVWPKKDANGKFIFPPPAYRSMNRLNTDSLLQPLDTVANYLVNAGHIYEVTDEGLLERGYHYTRQQDTFIITKKDTLVLDLGRNAFLREIGNDLYALNMLNQAIGEENRWWKIVLFEKKGRDLINTWYPSYKLTKKPSMFYQKDNTYYFNSEWGTAEMLGFIKQGAFENCNPLKRVVKK